MIRFVCQCGRQLQAKEDDVGRQAKCPACGRVMLVPKDAPRKARRPRDDEEDDDFGPDDEPPGPPPRNRAAGWALGLGVASIVLGVASPFVAYWFQSPAALWAVPLALFGVPGLAGLVLGVVGLARGGRKGTAVGGIATSAVSLILVAPLVVVVAMTRPEAADVRTSSVQRRDQENLKRISQAFLEFSDAKGRLPAAGAYRAAGGRPGLSWRVALLPQLGHEKLFARFKLDEPWDGPTNKPLLAETPQVYLLPDQSADAGLTHYQVFVGPGTLFEETKGQAPVGELQLGQRWLDVTDGPANTLLVTAGRTAVPWTRPDDLEFVRPGPLPPLCDKVPGGFSAAFGDGRVRFVPATTTEATLRGYITRGGGESVTPPSP